MITLIICAIIGAGIGIGAMFSDGDAGAAPFGAIVGAAFGALFGVIACILIGGIFYDGTETVAQKPVPLVSMADGAGIHGNFFLGSGSIDSSPSFTWYEKNGHNSYVRRDVDANISTIHYTDDAQKPYYVETDDCGKHDDLPSFAAWGFNMDKGCYQDHFDFYVPKGSIVQSYVLDNK